MPFEWWIFIIVLFYFLSSIKAKLIAIQDDIAELKNEFASISHHEKVEVDEKVDNFVEPYTEQTPLHTSQADIPPQEPIKPEPVIIESAEPTQPPYAITFDPPPPPSEANMMVANLIRWILSYFTGGNIIVRVGGVLLFLGLAFLVDYTAKQGLVSLQFRLMSVAIFAGVLIAIGWRLRKREGAYGLVLQGIGVALLYLTIYASAKYYMLLSFEMAFVLMLCVIILGSVLAVAQDGLVLGLFSITGGFLTPILTSDGTGSHVMLFGYYALLDVSIFIMAWYRSWRIVNITAFFFTFVIATFWGVVRYEAQLFDSTEPFLILFYLLFLGVSILFTRKQPYKNFNYIDTTLVFGLPVVGFGLQFELVSQMEHGVTYSALGLGALYVILARILFASPTMRLLAESFLALGVIFLTLAIPYMFDDNISDALWVLEGAAVVWISLRQEKKYGQFFGLLLQTAGLVQYLFWSLSQKVGVPFFNSLFLGFVIIIVALLMSSYLIDRYNEAGDENQTVTSGTILTLGLFTWIFAGVAQSSVESPWRGGDLMLLYGAISAIPLALFGWWSGWQRVSTILQSYLLFGVVVFISLFDTYNITHPFAGLGLLAILSYFIVYYSLLYRYDHQWFLAKAWHAIALWAIVVIGDIELLHQARELGFEPTVRYLLMMLPPLVAFYAIFCIPWSRVEYPIYRRIRLYRMVVSGALVVAMIFWEFLGFFGDGWLRGLGYMPLLSPFDMTQLVVVGTIFYWIYHTPNPFGFPKKYSYWFVGVMGFLLLDVILARGVHAYAHIPYDIDVLLQSNVFHAGLSILWSIIAMGLMLWAKQYQYRILWIVGMSLFGLVILKLLFVDLDGVNTIEKAISFVGVGLLMLLIGYFAPIPPKKPEVG